MLFHNTTKPKHGTTTRDVHSAQQPSLIVLPRKTRTATAPSPQPTYNFSTALTRANKSVDINLVFRIIYANVLGCSEADLREQLPPIAPGKSPFSYLPTMSKIYLTLATETIQLGINGPMTLYEIYDVVEKTSELIGRQAQEARELRRINLITGQPLEGC